MGGSATSSALFRCLEVAMPCAGRSASRSPSRTTRYLPRGEQSRREHSTRLANLPTGVDEDTRTLAFLDLEPQALTREARVPFHGLSHAHPIAGVSVVADRAWAISWQVLAPAARGGL